jgi:phosphosulfolactate synthase
MGMGEIMMTNLELPERPAKPRSRGITMVIDTGLPTRYFEDGVASFGDTIDWVKFGWCTALVTKDFDRKVSIARDHGVKFCFGGTMFEKFLQQDRFEDFVDLCRTYQVPVIEISNGTIPISNMSKSSYITKLADEFEVVSEVGFKDAGRSDEFTSAEWIEAIEEDLAAGSTMVITESRESGKAGICTSSGDLRTDVIDDILATNINIDQVLFEAPNKALQTYFIERLGPNVNLGNIALDDCIGLETLRLGLRSDTLLTFEG